jgi:hypothetical protein
MDDGSNRKFVGLPWMEGMYEYEIFELFLVQILFRLHKTKRRWLLVDRKIKGHGSGRGYMDIHTHNPHTKLILPAHAAFFLFCFFKFDEGCIKLENRKREIDKLM